MALEVSYLERRSWKQRLLAHEAAGAAPAHGAARFPTQMAGFEAPPGRVYGPKCPKTKSSFFAHFGIAFFFDGFGPLIGI